MSSRIASLLVVLLFAAPLFLGTGAAVATSPSPSNANSEATPASILGAPILTGAYLVGDQSVLIFVGAESWTAEWNPTSNGSQIFSNQLILVAFDIKGYPVTLYLDAYQSNHGWVQNQSLTLTPLTETTITVQFVNDPSWRYVVLLMDGVPFNCYVATPISLLPPNILNIGGLDLLIFAVISETLIVSAGMVGLARIVQRRTKFAKKFSLLVWGHVTIIGLIGLVLVDYQWVDQTFAGWSPLFYAFTIAPLAFVSSLSLFNDSQKVELLQRIARPNGKILYRRWLLRVARLADGRLVLVDERWRGWLARLFGKYVVVELGEEFETVKFEAETKGMRSPTFSQGKQKISDRFKLANPQEDEVDLLWWTDTGDPIKVKWPHLTLHRMKHVEAELDPETKTVLVPAHDERKLSLPHYTESEVELYRAADDYKAVEALAADAANIRDLARVLSKFKTAFYALKGAFSGQLEAEKESSLTAYYSAVGRTIADLTDEEAEQAAKHGTTVPSLAELLDEVRFNAANRPKPKTGVTKEKESK